MTHLLDDPQYEALIEWLKYRKGEIEDEVEDFGQLKPLLALLEPLRSSMSLR